MNETSPEPTDKGQEPQRKAKERYYKVRFHNASDANATQDVELGCNGEMLVIQRNVPTIIPERFKVVADNAVGHKFSQRPNELRKIIATVQTYPYDLIGEATEKEYEALKASGTKQLMATVAANPQQ